MRIVQIMLSDDFGGAERSFVEISKILQAVGHTVLAIGSNRSKSLDKLESANIACKRLSCLGTWDIFTIRSLRRSLLAFGPDVIQCHLSRASHLGGAAGASLGIPVVAKTHNLVNPKYYRNVTKIVVTTKAQRNHLFQHGIAPERIRLIPNFSSIKPTLVKKNPNKEPGLFKIVSLGRFVKKKGFDNLLRAISFLKARPNWHVSLSLGGDGPECFSLRQLAEELDMSQQVEFCGWVENIQQFLADADLFVLPSRDEPFGIVVLEAMASGVPILATKTQGPLEILDKTTGTFTPTDDPKQMAVNIENLLGSDRRYTLAMEAMLRFEKLYTAEKVCDRYCALFRELVGQETFR